VVTIEKRRRRGGIAGGINVGKIGFHPHPHLQPSLAGPGAADFIGGDPHGHDEAIDCDLFPSF